MQVVSSLQEFDATAGTAVSVGVFDGFHLGHARVVEVLEGAAAEHSVRSCVVTFATHPRKALEGAALDLVSSMEHRLVLLERAGVDVVVALEFTPDLAALTAERFVREVLVESLGARALVVGHDARMGAGAEADAEGIVRIGRAAGLDVRVVEPVVIGGGPVSSTRVRQAIHSGDLRTASTLLGRRVSTLGKVVRGQGRGRTLGFPTANVDVHREVRPPWGAYATRVRVEGLGDGWLASATNVGPRLTFDSSSGDRPADGRRPDLLIETHILEPPAVELYGRAIEVEFVKKLRDERRFSTDGELSRQIARDVEAAREILAEEGLA